MFTLEQIDELHSRLGKAETLYAYARALHAIGVEKYDSYLVDGHSEYVGINGHKVISPPHHETLPIAETSDREAFLAFMQRVEQDRMGYLEMSRGLATCGIEKWTVNTVEATMTYSDRAGNELLAERLSEIG